MVTTTADLARGERRVPPIQPSESDAASVARYLTSFEWPMRNKEAFERTVAQGVSLWLEFLRLVPPRSDRGQLLELGSPPFHITLLLQRFRNYELTLTGATTDRRARIQQEYVSPAYAERHTFDCVCFDVEREPFPFPDNAFDVVMWCEVIEHLKENPVFTLSEIHRVLKPGGALVISTPNVACWHNVLRLARGVNIYDPYHLGSPLRGSRHSREYTLVELTGLLRGCGFRIDIARGHYMPLPKALAPVRLLRRLRRWLARRAPGEHADWLLVRGRKDGPFRWTFPPDLFDGGHLLWYEQVRDSEVVMGVNDIPHTSLGWGALEVGPDQKTQRRARPVGIAYLMPKRSFRRVVVELCGVQLPAPVDVELVTFDGDTPRRLVSVRTQPPPGCWTRFEIPLHDPPVGKRLQVRVVAESGVYVHRLALES
jgi:SAM-dependent methyltransferase